MSVLQTKASGSSVAPVVQNLDAYLKQHAITLPDLYATENQKDPIAHIKLFTPDSSFTWYITECDGEDICFGLVDGFERELGYFSLEELYCVKGPLGLPIEIDLNFRPTPISKLP